MNIHSRAPPSPCLVIHYVFKKARAFIAPSFPLKKCAISLQFSFRTSQFPNLTQKRDPEYGHEESKKSFGGFGGQTKMFYALSSLPPPPLNFGRSAHVTGGGIEHHPLGSHTCAAWQLGVARGITKRALRGPRRRKVNKS